MSQAFKLLESFPHTKEKKFRGLHDMQTLDRMLGYPSRKLPYIHVAGTNGKGSVTLKIARALELKPQKVGLFISPHIVTFHERISINGMNISEEEALEGIYKIKDAASQQNIYPTFFEVITLLAFVYFAKHQVDIGVLEVGMGGRLDATNIITPLLSVITSIDFDHMQYLGETKEEIAREKGGIIKPSIPVVLGPFAKTPPLYEIAKLNQSPVIETLGTFINYEEENKATARTALRALNVPTSQVEVGLLYEQPCRFEVLDPELPFIMDVAHNPAGFKALFQRLNTTYPNKEFRILAAFSKGKDLKDIFVLLKKHSKNVHLTSTNHPRLCNVEDFMENDFFVDPSLQRSLDRVVALAKENNEGVLVCGTFFIMADIKAYVAKERERELACVESI